MNSVTVSQTQPPPMGKRLSYGLKTLGCSVLVPFAHMTQKPLAEPHSTSLTRTWLSNIRASRAKMQLEIYEDPVKAAALFAKSYEIIFGSATVPTYLSNSKEEILQAASGLEEKCESDLTGLIGELVRHPGSEKDYGSLFKVVAEQRILTAKLFGLLGDMSCCNTICSEDAVYHYGKSIENLQAASKILKERLERYSSTSRLSICIAAKESEIEGKMLNSSEALFWHYEGATRGHLGSVGTDIIQLAREACEKAIAYCEFASKLASKRNEFERSQKMESAKEKLITLVARASSGI